ncbi:MAG: hypothetical protein Q9M34_08755 [Sulfurimonas sp.]|nr:hypothetical protein [Sulfurimonas sp.]
MVQKVLASALLGLVLLFSGCGSSDNEGESALETQQLLDNGQYASVIAKLEGDASSTNDYIALASAYMGKAGFSLSSIIGVVVASAESGNNSTFGSFIENASNESNSQSLQDLDKAVEYFQKVVLNKCTDNNTTLSGAESDICLYVGLSKVSQTAVAISYITDDITVFNDTNTSDNKLTAATCAMTYAFDGNTTSNPDCTISPELNVTFVESSQTYGDINVTVGGEVFEYLISGVTAPKSTVITNGFCTVESFASRVADKNSSDYNATTYHVCPIDETNTTSTTTEEILVSALNDGTDSIGAAASDDLQTDIDQFKNDVLAANGRSINDANTTITMEDIIQYLDQQN